MALTKSETDYLTNVRYASSSTSLCTKLLNRISDIGFSIKYTLNWTKWISNIQKEKIKDYIESKIETIEKKIDTLKWKRTLDYFKLRSNELKDISTSFVGGNYYPPEV